MTPDGLFIIKFCAPAWIRVGRVNRPTGSIVIKSSAFGSFLSASLMPDIAIKVD
jgi:hypothetical protein